MTDREQTFDVPIREVKMDAEDLLLTTTNAHTWATEFMYRFGDRRDEIDVGLMISWFANAIETGRTAGERAS